VTWEIFCLALFLLPCLWVPVVIRFYSSCFVIYYYCYCAVLRKTSMCCDSCLCLSICYDALVHQIETAKHMSHETYYTVCVWQQLFLPNIHDGCSCVGVKYRWAVRNLWFSTNVWQHTHVRQKTAPFLFCNNFIQTSSIKTILAHVYLSKFPITHVFCILYIFRDGEPA